MAIDTPVDVRRRTLISALIREAILEKLAWLRAMPFWAISALVHLVLLLVLLTVVVRDERAAAPPAGDIEIRFQPTPSAAVAPDRPNPPERGPDPTTVLSRLKIPIPGPEIVVPKPEKSPSNEMPEGPRTGRTNIDLGLDDARGIWEAIGIGSQPPGRLGVPGGTGDFARPGGPRGDAVRAALDWLANHQSPDGSWQAAGFLSQCRSPCRSLDPAAHGDGRGRPEHDVGVTALAMLAFTGCGNTHWDGTDEKYVHCLRKAVQFMKKVQVQSSDPASNGRYGSDEAEQWMYNHAIATLAMAELLVISNDVLVLKPSVTEAVKLCLRARNSGAGWRYGIQSGENDTSVTGWMVLALKTARHGRLDIPGEDFQAAFAGALDWLDKATASSGKTGYMAPGDEGSRLNEVHAEPYPFSKDISSMTAVGVLCRLLAGESRGTRTVRDGVKILMKNTPRWQERKGRALSTTNFYYWYYGSYALFLYGGAEWDRWSKDMIAALVESQRKGKGMIDEDGSWDPADEWGPAGGRVYSTALGALTLEVYQRAQRLERVGPPARAASPRSSGERTKPARK